MEIGECSMEASQYYGATETNVETVVEIHENVEIIGEKQLVENQSIDEVNVASVVNHPSVGMEFDSWVDIDKYYKEYGKHMGFGVIRPQSAYFKAKKDGQLVRRCTTWACDCSGKPLSRRGKNGSDPIEAGVNGVKTKASKKCECPAMLYAAARNVSGTWVVRKVVVEHVGHNLNPLANNIRQYREFEAHMKKRMLDDFDAGLKLPQIHAAMTSERDGYDNMPVTLDDMRKEIAKEKKLKLQDGDANAMMKYFSRMHKDNSNFFHMIRHDNNGCLKDVLWVDARSRAAYEEFGDVVCFDTTYLTNEYDLPFANFVGVNHHGQTILLGCALISHETTETFEWVFETWLGCMGDKAPVAILTDQAAAMRAALRNIMPDTRHRWCIWHILKKFPAKLGILPLYQEFSKGLKDVIYDSYSAKEFEDRWGALMDEYPHLKENEWLKGLYIDRKMWVPAYTKHLFWAGMRSTQRVESIHSFFDTYINPHTRLYEFVEKYMHAMEARANSEKEADENSDRYVIPLATNFMVEKDFQKVYTNEKFNEFQTECSRVMYLNCREEKVISETKVEHTIQDRVWVHMGGRRESVPTEKRRTFTVEFNKLTHEVHCECKLFECSGILCRHAISVYETHNVQVVPRKYILRRWRKDVHRKHTSVKVAYHDPSKTEEVQRYDKMHVAFETISIEAMANEDATDFVMDSLRDLKMKVHECFGKKETSSVDDNDGEEGLNSINVISQVVATRVDSGSSLMVDSGSNNLSKSTCDMSRLCDPPARQRRGQVRTTRMKGIDDYVGQGKQPPGRRKAQHQNENVNAAEGVNQPKRGRAVARGGRGGGRHARGGRRTTGKEHAESPNCAPTPSQVHHSNAVPNCTPPAPQFNYVAFPTPPTQLNDGRWIGGIQVTSCGQPAYFSRASESGEFRQFVPHQVYEPTSVAYHVPVNMDSTPKSFPI